MRGGARAHPPSRPAHGRWRGWAGPGVRPTGRGHGAGAESGTAPVLALRPNNIYILGRSANASRSHFFYPAAPPPWGGPARRPMGGRQGGRPLGRPPSRWSRRPAGGTGGPGTANGRAGLVSHYRRTGKSGPGPRPLPVPC
uniref:ORF_09L n=1 Tax=Human herpesvirus 1 (strain R15) TaxID=36345 RepID=Q6VB68_HHV1R|nr:ORF_09L [Human alphaherpesvirus 1 strain R-15]